MCRNPMGKACRPAKNQLPCSKKLPRPGVSSMVRIGLENQISEAVPVVYERVWSGRDHVFRRIHQRQNLPTIPVRRHGNVLSLNGKWIFLQIYCMILQYRAFKRYKSGKPRTIISQKSFCVTYISFHFTFYAQAISTTCTAASGSADVISIARACQ